MDASGLQMFSGPAEWYAVPGGVDRAQTKQQLVLHKDTFHSPVWSMTLSSPGCGRSLESSPGSLFQGTSQTHLVRAQDCLGQCRGLGNRVAWD